MGRKNRKKATNSNFQETKNKFNNLMDGTDLPNYCEQEYFRNLDHNYPGIFDLKASSAESTGPRNLLQKFIMDLTNDESYEAILEKLDKTDPNKFSDNLIFLIDNLKFLFDMLPKDIQEYSSIPNKILNITEILVKNINEKPNTSVLDHHHDISRRINNKLDKINNFLKNPTLKLLEENKHNYIIYFYTNVFIELWNKSPGSFEITDPCGTNLLNWAIRAMPSKNTNIIRYSAVLETIKFLITKNPKLIDGSNNWNCHTPLHDAIYYEQYEVANLIINLRPDLIKQKYLHNDFHPYQYALNLKLTSNKEVPPDLLDKLLPFNPFSMTEDECRNNLLNPDFYLYTTCFKVLNEKFPNIFTDKNHLNATLLHNAVRIANTNHKDPLKCNAILNTVTFFIKEANVEINAQESKQGYTALNYAIAYKNYPVVNLLIELNADLSLKNNYNQTPYQYALELEREMEYNIPQEVMKSLQR